MKFTRATWLGGIAIATIAVTSNAHADIAPKLKPVATSLTRFVALLEQLQPNGPRTKWEDPATPGHAADLKQKLNDAGCVYDIPTGPQQGTPGLGFGHIEVGGDDCPIEVSGDIKGSLVDHTIDAGFTLHYKIKDPSALPDEDVLGFDAHGTFKGTIDANQNAGYAKVQVLGDMGGTGTSRSQGAFTQSSHYDLDIDISGFNMLFSEEEDHAISIGGESGKFKSVSKMEGFSFEEAYFIDDKESSKEDYRAAIDEFRFPFFSTGLGGGKSTGTTACRSELFSRAGADLKALQEYAAKGTAIDLKPVKALNACQGNMKRDVKWDNNELSADFQFGHNYLMAASVFTQAGHAPSKARPLYVAYNERQGRVEEVGADFYLVQICEPVNKCE